MTSSPPPRQRVILAHRRGARMVRTRVEVQEQRIAALPHDGGGQIERRCRFPDAALLIEDGDAYVAL